MTKKIRIENADTSSHIVNVRVENLVDGAWVKDESMPAVSLAHPTSLAELYIHDRRRLVIEEG